MKKQWRSTGFTLVELMMVIAIIAILALVLIPQAGFMKQYAKDAGVETNIRVVEATAIRLLVKFPATQDGLADFNLAMARMLDDNVRNPFTQNQHCLPLAEALPTVCTAGVQGVGGGANGRTQTSTLFPGTGAVAPGNRGAVLFSAFLDVSEGLVCHVWGYDGDGRILRGVLIGEAGATPLTPLGNTFSEITAGIIALMQERLTTSGSYGRTWDDYRYTDIGLDPADWQSPIGHIRYTPSGADLRIGPETGYTFYVNDLAGNARVLPATYNWNLIYNDSSKMWYYHSVAAGNEVDITTLEVR